MQTALKCSKFIPWLNTEEFAEMLSNEKKLDIKFPHNTFSHGVQNAHQPV